MGEKKRYVHTVVVTSMLLTGLLKAKHTKQQIFPGVMRIPVYPAATGPQQLLTQTHKPEHHVAYWARLL